jgi:hypothetical protein
MAHLRVGIAALTIFLCGAAIAADGPSAATLCGYAPHNHVFLLDRGLHLWLQYPASDPLRAVEFGEGLRSYRAETNTCARLYMAAGSGTISWGSVRIQIADGEIRVNGQVARFETNLSVDPEGKLSPNAFIRTFH